MKKRDIEKIKNKSEGELKADLAAAREKLWQVKKDIAGGKVKNVREARLVRNDIARMLTLINAKRK